MKIIVWIEFSHGKVKSASLEALGSARTLAESASGEVIAVLCGPGAGQAASSMVTAGAHPRRSRLRSDATVLA